MKLSAGVAFVAALALGTAAAGSARTAVFPCHSNWTIDEGKPPGQVVAGFGVNCNAIRRNESLTVTGRLLRLNAQTGKWLVERTKTAHWADLTATRKIDLREPCRVGVFRASFVGVLRYPGGRVAGKLSVNTSRLQVVVPCVFNT
jgi:hypothetical protein